MREDQPMRGCGLRHSGPCPPEDWQEAAERAWAEDPKEAFKMFGLPCWCGRFGGCAKCEDR